MAKKSGRDPVTGQFIAGNDAGARFESGNTAALKHGGEAAILRLTDGGELTGIARELELAAQEDIAHDGILAVMQRQAARHLAVANLYFGLVLGADEPEELDKRVKRFGWLNAAAQRMLSELRKAARAGGDSGVVADALASARAELEESGDGID